MEKVIQRNGSKDRRTFFQLAGHKEAFRNGTKNDTILKLSLGDEGACLDKLMKDKLRDHVPKFYGIVKLPEDGKHYLEMEDLLSNFDLSNISLMDVKMGCRTYHEEELEKALREGDKLRPDMYDKMIQVDKNEPTYEENFLKAVTKPRYMIWRENLSSTATLAFRIEAMRLRDGSVHKDFKTTKSEDLIARTFLLYASSRKIRLSYIQKLYDLRDALTESNFFENHELIGCSLLLVHDEERAGIWLIDFAKTKPLPNSLRITHRKKWLLGNHEDGFLIGVNNLIRIFESITLTRLSQ